MKILHVISNITVAFGGPMTTMNNIIGIWQAGGYEAHILAIETRGKKVPVNVELDLVRPSFPSRFSNSNQALEWLEGHFAEFDLVLFHSIWLVTHLRLAALLRRNGRRYVVIPHGALDPFDLQKKALAKKILGPVLIQPYLAGSAAVLCSTHREADKLVTYGARCNKVVLPWVIPPVETSVERAEGRKWLNAADEFVVLFLGRIDYKKGFPVLLPAFKRLLVSGTKARLIIAGPDSNNYTAKVRRLVDRLDMNSHVTFFPAVVGEEKMKILKGSDCFALPSLNENFGNAVVEAMQQGLPAVISNNVYLCDDVQRGKAGFVCDYDEVSVFSALRKLAENQELRATMSVAARHLAEEFSPDALKSRYFAVLDELLRNRDVKQSLHEVA